MPEDLSSQYHFFGHDIAPFMLHFIRGIFRDSGAPFILMSLKKVSSTAVCALHVPVALLQYVPALHGAAFVIQHLTTAVSVF